MRVIITCVAALVPALWVALPASGQSIEYNSEEVAPSVYLFAPNDAGLGNVAVVLSEGEALVVDAGGTPGAALQILSQLRDLGMNRVVALVNTHWHDDHIWGNQVFVDAFPDLQIHAHPATLEGIRDRAVPGLSSQITRLHQRIDERATQLETGVKQDGTPLTAEERTQLEGRQALFRDAVESLESVTPVLPNEIGEERRIVRVGEIEVWVDHVGAGHTPGDLIVHVPSSRVVIAGDLVTQPVPAAAEADLRPWISALEALDRMDWVTLVPGHGSAQSDRAYVTDVLALFRDVVDYVANGIQAGTDVDALVEGADFSEFRSRWLAGDARQEAMFRAFFLEPALRSTYAAMAGA